MLKNKNIQFIVLFILFTFLLDFTFGTIYKVFYFSDESRINDPLIHSILEANEDILIFGSSRAMHHYNPDILEDSLGLTCFNVGSGGQNIFYHLAILEGALVRYKPKIVLLELMTIDFEVTPSKWETEKLGTLLPFYKKSLSAQKAIMRRGFSEKIKSLSFIYPYNSLIYTIFRNNYFPFKNNSKGFIPIDRVWTKALEKEVVSEVRIDSVKLNSVYEFIELCQTNKIDLYIFISPNFNDRNGKSKYSQVTAQIKTRYDVKIFNLEDDKYFLNNSNLFADPVHLNAKGADEFTSLVTSTIKKHQ